MIDERDPTYVAFSQPPPAAPLDAPRCAALHGIGPAAEQCVASGAFDAFGVPLCYYHQELRAYRPVVYLADGRGLVHDGIIDTPPQNPQPDTGVGTVDALVAAIDALGADARPTVPPGMRPAAPPLFAPYAEAVAWEDAVRGTVFTDATETVLPPAPVPVPPFMSTDSAVRKGMPVASGFLQYFPDAVLIASVISRVGNDKHNPGQPLHWDKSKSTDEPDAEVRHMLDRFRGLPPDPGLESLAHLGHYASKLWRAAADCQRACDDARAVFERGEDWRK